MAAVAAVVAVVVAVVAVVAVVVCLLSLLAYHEGQEELFNTRKRGVALIIK